MSILSLLGVRYAQPPIGQLRFEKPAEIKWEGVADATQVGNHCPQPILTGRNGLYMYI